MTFARVNPSGWATDGEVTTSQINTLDADHANAVDKSVAGDGVFGSLAFTVGVTTTGGESVVSQGPVKTASGGRVILGDNDNVLTSAPRPIARCAALLFDLAGTDGWDVDQNSSTNVGAPGQTGTMDVSRKLIDGATLTSFDVYFLTAVHTLPPATVPAMSLFKRSIATGAVTFLVRGSPAIPTTGNKWFNNGAPQTFNVPANLTIDLKNFGYFVFLIDEHGAGALTGTQWLSTIFNMTVSDARPI